MKKTSESKGIYTIGHSVHESARFLELLKLHCIEAVADVRSMPYSRWQPQFNREELSKALKGQGIAYVFLGKELGARSDDPNCYENGRVQYRRLARTKLFRSGIQRVVDGSERMNIALMCAEKDPLDCHRAILVARELVGLGKEVAHILATGETETHGAAMKRLYERLGLSEGDLFRGSEDLDDEAYSMQEQKIAYVDEEHTPEKQGGQQ